jgi:hypothetical protein
VLEGRKQADARADDRRVAAPDGNGARHDRDEERACEAMVVNLGADPDLDLGHDGQDDGGHTVDHDGVGAEVPQACQEAKHALTVDREPAGVISRTADPEPPEDQPFG